MIASVSGAASRSGEGSRSTGPRTLHCRCWQRPSSPTSQSRWRAIPSSATRARCWPCCVASGSKRRRRGLAPARWPWSRGGLPRPPPITTWSVACAPLPCWDRSSSGRVRPRSHCPAAVPRHPPDRPASRGPRGTLAVIDLEGGYCSRAPRRGLRGARIRFAQVSVGARKTR